MRKLLIISIVSALALMTLSCATGEGKYRTAVREGNYNLIIVQSDDGGSPVAVLDRLDDEYEITPQDAKQIISTQFGLDRREAIRRADEELPGSGVVLSEVYGLDDHLAGYQAYPPPDHSLTITDADSMPQLMPNLIHFEIGKGPHGKRIIRLRVLPLSPKNNK